jgi:MFS family permease
MDTFGAFIGPLIALVYLQFYPAQYTNMFLLALIPGAMASAFSLLLREGDKPAKASANNNRMPNFSLARFWKTSNVAYKKLLAGLLVFALVNSSDVFLLLQMKESGIKDSMVIGAYVFYNLIYALGAYPMGKLADAWGLKKTFMLGLLLFVVVYGCFPLCHQWWMFCALLFLYGIYAAATEGISKAWISNITPKENTATAIGTYSGMQSIAAFLASSIGGIIWFCWGAVYTFSITAAVVVLVIIYFRLSSIAEK